MKLGADGRDAAHLDEAQNRSYEVERKLDRVLGNTLKLLKNK